MSETRINFEDFKGKTFVSVTQGTHDSRWEKGMDALHFEDTEGKKYVMYHQQDCCESVNIEEIVGDLNDLVGYPILEATEETNSGDGDHGDSETWTYYNIRTVKGNVNIRWYGTSNGYYSESVDVYEITE